MIDLSNKSGNEKENYNTKQSQHISGVQECK